MPENVVSELSRSESLFGEKKNCTLIDESEKKTLSGVQRQIIGSQFQCNHLRKLQGLLSAECYIKQEVFVSVLQRLRDIDNYAKVLSEMPIGEMFQGRHEEGVHYVGGGQGIEAYQNRAEQE